LTTNEPALFATAPGNRGCRIAERASYERETVNAILDASYLCHIVDGLALGHSAFNHAYTYRSVVIHGRAEAVVDPAAKTEAMREFVETIIPGRWAQVRPVKESEIRSIALVRIKLDQVSAKVRDAYPDEETVDPDWPVWVGVIPAKLVFGAPLPDPVRNWIPVAPEHVAGFRSMDGFAPAYGTTADGQAS
jgi:hypothetical protein